MNPPPTTPEPPWAHGPYSIKRHGVTITNCDTEPVQAPGCIQAHGAMLVLRPAELTILQASENTAEHLGQPPERLLGQPVRVVLGPEGTARLQEALRREAVERNPFYLFSLPAGRGSGTLDLSVHTIDGVAVLEFEPTGREGNHPAPDYYVLLKSTVARLQTARTLRDFCQVVAEEVRALTGLDRVMVYRFHPDAHGEVFAESKRADLPPWLGLHYPADDIPTPAREVFKRIWIRPLPDAAGPLMELVPLVNPDTGRPLTMTYCALRGASVMYTEYLRNMGVAASLTLSLLPENELWGLIACHHYQPAYFSYQVRAACEFLAQVVSLQLRAAENREHLVYRLRLEGVHQQLVALAAQEGSLAAITDSRPNLLDGMQAGGAALFHGERWWRLGHTPSEPQLEALAGWLRTQPEFSLSTSPVYATDCLARAYLPGAEFAAVASGVLAVPLSSAAGNLMLWFRPETLQTVNWAGNPQEKPTVPGPHGPRLTPRRSFELFVESVHQRALPWSRLEIAAAARLRLLVMELVVSRAERLALLNAELSRSNEELDAFAYIASHDLKEPLRGIYRYAQQLLASAGELEPENRDRLEALTRLTARMDSLLDALLHFSRVGRTQLELERVDLNAVVAEALEMVSAARSEVPCDVIIPRPLPQVRCDRVRVREIYTNLLSNALKYSDKPRRRIELGYLGPAEKGARPTALAEAAGQTILFVADDGIGIEERHHQHIFEMFRRLHGRNAYGGGAGAGLTIVKKLVERHGGRIWLRSAPGQGATFFFTLPLGESAGPAT